MVDDSPKAVAAIEVNARILGADERLQIVRSDALRFIASVGAHFDVVFFDPLFRQGWIERLAPNIPGVLAEHGVIYAEAEKALEGCGRWRTVRHGRAGQVFYHLMRRGEADGTEQTGGNLRRDLRSNHPRS